MPWQPSADFETLKKRAELIDRIRAFFKARDFLEVETPLLCQHTVTDRYIESFKTNNRYLQTSPEYTMKRLLVAGSGPLFQITKAFRQEQSGHLHNPEFTLLEWYRPKFNHHDLMAEMSSLLVEVAGLNPAIRLSYRDIFKSYCDIDVFTCTDDMIKNKLTNIDSKTLNRDTCLQLLLSEKIEPKLGYQAPIFIYDFPVNQAALAKIRYDDPPVAERFEVYIQGKEIANGFHELTDPQEQRQRFRQDQAYRQLQQKNIPDIDDRLIQALEVGLPNCAGVALGIDRLLMCLIDKKHIKEVITFDWNRA